MNQLYRIMLINFTWPSFLDLWPCQVWPQCYSRYNQQRCYWSKSNARASDRAVNRFNVQNTQYMINSDMALSNKTYNRSSCTRGLQGNQTHWYWRPNSQEHIKDFSINLAIIQVCWGSAVRTAHTSARQCVQLQYTIEHRTVLKAIRFIIHIINTVF